MPRAFVNESRFACDAARNEMPAPARVTFEVEAN